MVADRWCWHGHEAVGWNRNSLGDNCWYCGEWSGRTMAPSTEVPKSIRNPNHVNVSGSAPDDDEDPTDFNDLDVMPYPLGSVAW